MACRSPYFVDIKGNPKAIPVPCGRCPPCQRRRINDWVFRLLQEDKVSVTSYFVTLTYDNDSVPLSPRGWMTLNKSDYQKYMKRLRKLSPRKLKYYAVGEYGSKTDRPHYHAIIFNALPDDIVDAWSVNGVPIGNVFIGNVSGDSIGYTAKYISKESRIPVHARDDRIKEFSLMSKGLGKCYLDDVKNVKYHKADLSRTFVTHMNG